MHLLAFDTAAGGCSAGVFVDGEALASRAAAPVTAAAEQLPPLLLAVLGDAGVGLERIDLLAVSVGPGSFSGIRTGLAAARGLALVTGKKAVAVTTLEAVVAPYLIAEDAGEPAAPPLVVVLDARRGEVFVQPFAADGRPLDRPRVMAPALAAAGLAAGCRLVGDGAPLLLPHVAGAPPACWPGQSDAAGVAKAALAALGRGVEPSDGTALRPLYVRAADARPDAGRALLPVGG